MPKSRRRDTPPHRRQAARDDRYHELDAEQRKELARYMAEFAEDWDAREERFRRTFNLIEAEGKMSREECDRRLVEIHETRLEHEREHRELMVDSILMTDEQWEAIRNDPEFQENMRQLQAMAAGMAEALKELKFDADPDDPVANLIRRNLTGSAERMSGAIDSAAATARDEE